MPRAIDSRAVKVVVIMRGDSVAIAQRNAGRALSDGERQAVISARRSEHESMTSTVTRHGGTVLGHLTGALNGLTVRIPRDKLDALRHADGVVDVKPVGIYAPTNVVSVPYIGAPLVWQAGPHYQGQNVKIGIIDTGIDYTHANFGGPGTVAAFQAASANSTAAADPTLFGPNAPKVKGGTDLVGDAYNAAAAAGSPALVPHPDSNPLDCNGHGSHVAGTAAGFGENADGTTYTGLYEQAAYTPGAFKIGPGVAPKADLYAIRVFGCVGSTDVVSEAIDWAVNNGMNVINMSLGSPYGGATNSESVAVANAIAAGIQVVVSQGNDGAIPYIGGAPAASDGAISVAAIDSTASYPGATLDLGAKGTITVQDNDGVTFANGTTYPVVVLRNPDGTISFGCNPAEYDPSQGGVSVIGKLVVTVRGSSCARVYRASVAQHFGAKASLLINNGAGYPPYEGAIGTDPANSPYEPVTIPFFGALQSDAPKFAQPAPSTATANNVTVPSPTFARIASFSSSGPRFGDSALRPAVSAPGVSIPSTLVGSGTGLTIESGTSMAAPHVSGVAALVKQAHPTWTLADLRAAIVQAASPTKLNDLSPRFEGTGLVQPLAATSTSAIMRVPNDSLSFGFADLLQDFVGSQTVTVHNTSPKPVTFKLASTKVVGPSGTTVSIPATVAVPANGDATFLVTVTVPAAAVGGTHDANGNTLFHDVGGYIQATPTDARLNANVSLSLPYYLVAYSRSNLATTAQSVLPLPADQTITVTNTGGAIAGTPDLYALGPVASQHVSYGDVRALGVQSFPGAGDAFMVFAINTFQRVSNAAGALEWDILIDTDGDGNADYIIVVANGSSYFTDPSVANKVISATYSVKANAFVDLFLADAPTDTSTILAPLYASDLGLTSAKPSFTYTVVHYSRDGETVPIQAASRFNAFTPALSGSFNGTIAPNTSGKVAVQYDATQTDTQPTGLMIVAPDNTAGPSQALLVPLANRPAR